MAALNRLTLLLAAIAGLAHAQYMGSKACYGCHTEIYKSFVKTDMGRSITPASEWKPDSLPAEAAAGRFSVSHNESGWHQSESEPGVYSVDHQLEYTVGSGENGLTFLIRRGSYLFQAPLSYYSKVKKWDLSPGYESVDLGFGRMVPQECINCHAGRAAPVNAFGAYSDPPFTELAIGCENCHGPGEAHVKSLGKASGTITNPAKLKPRLAENICINCHQGGDARVTQPGKTYLDFRPGEWAFDTAVIFKQPSSTSEQQQADLLEHYSAMQASRCFRESAGKLSCLTCHDPHVQPRQPESVAYYRAKCLTCHEDQSCKLSAKIRAAQTPPDDCAGCHMPKRSVTQISHSALTNHRIPAREGEPLTPAPRKETDGVVVVDPPEGRTIQLAKVVLLQAYRDLAAKNPEYHSRYLGLLTELSNTQPQDTFVQAALGDRALAEDRTEEAIGHLKLALAQGPAIYLELGQALAKLGRGDEAIEYLKKGVDLDPYNSVMQKTLILQYINARSYLEARSLMEKYVAAFPEDSLMRNLLARVSK
jgi:hypothetical protein